MRRKSGKPKDADAKLYNAFLTQISNADRRGIEFRLTFEEWLQVWQDSGRLSERGRKKGQYVMSRCGDEGPYAIGNVKIALGADNVREGAVRIVLTDESRLKISLAHRGKIVSKETRERQSRAHLGAKHTEEAKRKVSLANRGKVVSAETRKKQSLALKGRVFSEEYLKNLAKAQKTRKPVSEQGRINIGNAARGRLQSEETRKKRSITIKAWHQAKRLMKAAQK